MKRVRKEANLEFFEGPLWEDRGANPVEVLSALAQLAKEFNDNPEDFDEAWFRPLLTEGLKMDKVYELLLDGAIRPN
jgi:hypothetical protein